MPANSKAGENEKQAEKDKVEVLETLATDVDHATRDRGTWSLRSHRSGRQPFNESGP